MESKQERLFDRGAKALIKYGFDGTVYGCRICADCSVLESLHIKELSLGVQSRHLVDRV